MASKGTQFLPSAHIPHLDGTIITSTYHCTNRTESNTGNGSFMTCESTQFLPRMHVPNLNGAVVTSTGKTLQIRAKNDTVNGPVMSFKSAEYFSCGCHPELCVMVQSRKFGIASSA